MMFWNAIPTDLEILRFQQNKHTERMSLYYLQNNIVNVLALYKMCL